MRKVRICWNCEAQGTLEYDVAASGYVCQKCGTVYDQESVELGDYDTELPSIVIHPGTKTLTVNPDRPYKTVEDMWIWLGDQDIVQASALHPRLVLYDDNAYLLDDLAIECFLKGESFELSYQGTVYEWLDERNASHKEFMNRYKGVAE